MSRLGSGRCHKIPSAFTRVGVMQFKVTGRYKRRETRMYLSTPTLVEIYIGLEINGYLPAEI
jgi:hypothetical protein